MTGRFHSPWLVHPRLVPSTRSLVWTIVILTACNALTGLLYCLSFRLARDFGPGDGVIAALDLDAEGSLNCWLNSAVLLCGSLLSFALCRLRSVRGGGGRELFWWSWTALVLLAMSADEGGSLHEGFKELCVRLTGTRVMGDGSIYWAVPYAILLAVTFAAVFHYQRGQIFSRANVVLAATFLSLAAALQLELVLPTEDPLEIVAEELLEVQGSILFVSAIAAQLLAVLQSSVSFPATTRATGGAKIRVISASPPAAMTVCRRTYRKSDQAPEQPVAERAA